MSQLAGTDCVGRPIYVGDRVLCVGPTHRGYEGTIVEVLRLDHEDSGYFKVETAIGPTKKLGCHVALISDPDCRMDIGL